jgi:hypothetical protein
MLAMTGTRILRFAQNDNTIRNISEPDFSRDS